MLQTFGIAKHDFIPEYFYNLPFNGWYMIYGGIVLVANTVQRYFITAINIVLASGLTDNISAWNVMQKRKEQKKHAETALLGLVPYFVTWTIVPLYLYLQPVILNYHLVPFVFYVGLINAYSVGQIIIAHLTRDPKFPYQNILTIPLGLAVLDSLGPAIGLWPSALGNGTYQIALVFMCLGLGVGVYGSFVVCHPRLYCVTPVLQAHSTISSLRYVISWTSGVFPLSILTMRRMHRRS